jgi:biotin transport system substrate-specific component
VTESRSFGSEVDVTSALGVSTPTLFDVISRRKEGSSTFARSAAAVVGFALLTALLAQVRIGLGFTPVPITGQTLAVLLAGTTLGSRRGALSMALYWVVGMFVPFGWYSNSTHGWEVATGATAGYLFGFIVAAFVVGLLAERGQDRNALTSFTAMLFGTFVVYFFGVAWLAHKINVPVFDGDQNALTMGLVPFVAGDIIKLVIAGAVGPSAWKLVEGRKP